eukprot:5454328-Prymnesium_polylepis.1
MARVRDARTTRAGSHVDVEHQAGAGTARGSVMQGSQGCGVGVRLAGAPRGSGGFGGPARCYC